MSHYFLTQDRNYFHYKPNLASDDKRTRAAQVHHITDVLLNKKATLSPEEKTAGFRLMVNDYWWSFDKFTVNEAKNYISTMTTLCLDDDYAQVVPQELRERAESSICYCASHYDEANPDAANLRQLAKNSLYKIMISSITRGAEEEPMALMCQILANHAPPEAGQDNAGLYNAVKAYYEAPHLPE